MSLDSGLILVNSDIVSIGVSLIIAAMTTWVIINAIRKGKSWFLVGFFFVNFNGAVWSIFLPFAGLTWWMSVWRIGYSILFIISLMGLIYEAQFDN